MVTFKVEILLIKFVELCAFAVNSAASSEFMIFFLDKFSSKQLCCWMLIHISAWAWQPL